MTRIPVLLLAAAVAGCTPAPSAGPAIPACPTVRQTSGVWVPDRGPRPCLVPPGPLPGPTHRWQDLERGLPHTARVTDGGTPTGRTPLTPTH